VSRGVVKECIDFTVTDSLNKTRKILFVVKITGWLIDYWFFISFRYIKLNDGVKSTWKETVSILEPGTSLIKTDNDLILGILFYCLSNKFVLNIHHQCYRCVDSDEVQFDYKETARILLLVSIYCLSWETVKILTNRSCFLFIVPIFLIFPSFTSLLISFCCCFFSVPLFFLLWLSFFLRYFLPSNFFRCYLLFSRVCLFLLFNLFIICFNS
jgi:hypothetical protein